VPLRAALLCCAIVGILVGAFVGGAVVGSGVGPIILEPMSVMSRLGVLDQLQEPLPLLVSS